MFGVSWLYQTDEKKIGLEDVRKLFSVFGSQMQRDTHGFNTVQH